jgi:hypothetical protein
MATQKVVMAGSDVTALQLKDLFRQIGDGSLTGHHIQALLDHRDPFAVNLDPRYQLESQCQLWKELFGIELDPDSIALPERRPGFERLIVIPAGLTLNTKELLPELALTFQLIPGVQVDRKRITVIQEGLDMVAGQTTVANLAEQILELQSRNIRPRHDHFLSSHDVSFLNKGLVEPKERLLTISLYYNPIPKSRQG